MLKNRIGAGVLSAALMLTGTAIIASPAFAEALLSLSTDTTSGNYNLQWGAVDAATAYRVQVATDAGFTNILVDENSYSRNYAVRKNLSTDETRTLYWRVAAFTSGTSNASLQEWSEEESFVVPAATAPALNSPNDGATISYPSPIVFKWSGMNNAISYELQYSFEGNFSVSNATTTVTVSGKSYTPSESLAFGDWQWRVRSKLLAPSGETQYSEWSDPRSFVSEWSSANSKVNLITPTDSEILSDPIFTWNEIPGAASYRVVISRDIALTNPVVNTTLAETVFIPKTNLLNGNYYWQVTATNMNGTIGIPSDIGIFNKKWGAQAAQAAVPFEEAIPEVTTGWSEDFSTPTEVPYNKVIYKWNPVPRATLYKVDIDPIWTDVEPISGVNTVSCRTPNTSLALIVRAANGTQPVFAPSGWGDCSGVTKKYLESITNAPGLTLSLRVQAIDYNGSQTTGVQASTPANTLVTEKSVPQYYRVIPNASSGTSNPEGEISVNPATWANAVATQGDSAAPEMRWMDYDGASGYEVRIYRSSGTTNYLARFRTPQTFLRINGVFSNDNTGESYYWRVRPLTGDIASASPAYIGFADWDAQPAHQWTKNPDTYELTGSNWVASGNYNYFQWTPQFAFAPDTGASRGYSIQYKAATDGWGAATTEKIEFPFWVPQKSVSGALSSLAPGLYDFRVAPLDANGTAGYYSNSHQFQIQRAYPLNLTGTSDANTVNLQWDTAKAATGYQVRWRKGTTGSFTNIHTSNAVTKQRALAFVIPANGELNGTYEFQVRSQTAGTIYSDWSPSASVVKNVASITQLTANGATLSTSNRTLKWAGDGISQRYLVQVAENAAAVPSATPVEVVGASYTPSNSLDSTKTYYWRVLGVAETGTATASLTNRSILSASTVRSFAAQTPPKGFSLGSVASSGPAQISVGWTPLTGANAGTTNPVQYRLRYRPAGVAPAPAWQFTSFTTGSATSMLLTGLTANTSYEIQGQASNSEGTSSWTASKTAATASVPTAPRSLKVTTSDKTSLALTWTAPSSNGGSAITGYRVRWEDGIWKEVWATGTSYTITGLAPNTSYNIEVVAVNAIGSSSAATIAGKTSADSTSGTAKVAPKSVTSLKLVKKEKKVQISWAAPSGSTVTGYTIQVKPAKAKKWEAVAVKGTTTHTVKKGKGVLSVRVSAYNSYGASPFVAKKIK